MNRIRVLVVDDSVVIRKLVSDLLAEDPDIEVVGTAVNGRAGVQKVALLKPDLVTMDIEMPEMNGIEAVRELRAPGHAACRSSCSARSPSGAPSPPSTRSPPVPPTTCRSPRTSAASAARWSRCARR